MNLTGVLHLHSVSFSTCGLFFFFFFQKEKWHSFRERRGWGPAPLSFYYTLWLTAPTVPVFSPNGTENFLAKDEYGHSFLPATFWLHAFWQFIITQTMGIRFNCISHWLLTWFTESHTFCIFTSLFLALRLSIDKEQPICSSLMQQSTFILVFNFCYCYFRVELRLWNTFRVNSATHIH